MTKLLLSITKLLRAGAEDLRALIDRSSRSYLFRCLFELTGFYLTQSVLKVVLPKSISTQISTNSSYL